jgi:tetratricopeptide (TPR) repeat protein
MAFSKLGEIDNAQLFWNKASEGISEPAPAIFYNDQQPDTIYYQGLALIELGQPDEARIKFEKLINFGEKHKDDEFKMDYFAVSLPDLQIWDDDLSKRNHQNCLHLIALGKKGIQELP